MSPHKPTKKQTAALSLAALGVVFGDIGTSPLYSIREIFSIGDNILELNAAGSNDGGIYVRDAEGTSNSGSLLWNTGDDRWIGGVKGSEKILTFYNASPTTNTVLKANASDLLVDSAISDDGTAVTISSNLIISGLTASQLVVTNGSKQLVSSTDISSLTLTLDGGTF